MNAQRLAVIILSLVVLAPAMAADFPTGKFTLYAEPHHKVDAGCDHGTTLVMDKTTLNGNVAILENFLKGSCEIFVPANPRLFKLTSAKNDGCGSMVYTGTFESNRGPVTLTIVDNRPRTCENMIASLIEVHEKSAEGERVMYSLDR